MCVCVFYVDELTMYYSTPFFRYRFAEMRYHRPAEYHHGRLLPARIETVVIFLPDVWTCNPTQLEWENSHAAYKKQLLLKLTPESLIQALKPVFLSQRKLYEKQKFTKNIIKKREEIFQ